MLHRYPFFYSGIINKQQTRPDCYQDKQAACLYGFDTDCSFFWCIMQQHWTCSNDYLSELLTCCKAQSCMYYVLVTSTFIAQKQGKIIQEGSMFPSQMSVWHYRCQILLRMLWVNSRNRPYFVAQLECPFIHKYSYSHWQSCDPT